MDFDPSNGFKDVSKNYQSEVWNHFLKNEITEKAQCKHCDNILSCKNGGTTALVRHIQTIHPSATFKKLNRKSNVWNHFVKDKLRETAQCSHCNDFLPWNKTSATSNLLNHLKKKHQYDPHSGKHLYSVSQANIDFLKLSSEFG